VNDVIAAQARESDLAKVRRARRMKPEEKFLAGAELFEEASQWSLAGIAARHPEMTVAERNSELRRLLRLSVGRQGK
jgi:hypothetical protein